MTVMKYELVLKNEKVKTYRTIRDILALLNMLGLIYLTLVAPKDFKNLMWPVIGIFISALYFVIVVIERISKDPPDIKLARSVFLLTALAWSRTETFWWISLLLVFFWVMDIIAHRKLVVVFSTKFVRLPVIIPKKINWRELSNVILKDGMLTVDFKNNRIFQYPVTESGWEINEVEFNRFCQQQILNAVNV